MNKTILIGRLTKDPDVKYINGDTAVASFTLAVDRRFKNKDGNKEADFISCVAWNKTAELIEKYISKGSQIAISGRIQTRNYEATDGTRRYVTEVIAEEVQFIDTNRKTAENQSDSFMGEPMDGFEEVEELELPFL